MKRRNPRKVAAPTGAAASKKIAKSQSVSHDRVDIDSNDMIVKLVERAMKAAANGNVAGLRRVFHEKAQMFGEVYGNRFDEPIEAFFKLCKKNPLRRGGIYRSRIVSVTRVGGAAMVMVTEDGCWGSASYVDFFTVSRIDGAWKITNKTFAYTGGKIPPEVLE